MNDLYLTIIIIVAGIIELSTFVKEKKGRNRIFSFIIISGYFGEFIFYNIVKNSLISSLGCGIFGSILIICIIVRLLVEKKDKIED